MARIIHHVETVIDNKEVVLHHVNGEHESVSIIVDGVELVDFDCDIYVGSKKIGCGFESVADQYPVHAMVYEKYNNEEL